MILIFILLSNTVMPQLNESAVKCGAAAGIIFGVLIAAAVVAIILDAAKKIRFSDTAVSAATVILSPVLLGCMMLTCVRLFSSGLFGVIGALFLYVITIGILIYLIIKVAILPLDKKRKGFELRSKEHNHLLSARRMIISGLISAGVMLVIMIVFGGVFISESYMLIGNIITALIMLVVLIPFTLGISLLFIPLLGIGFLSEISGLAVLSLYAVMLTVIGFAITYILFVNACLRTGIYALKGKTGLKVCMMICGFLPGVNAVFAIVALSIGKKRLRELDETDIPEKIVI